MILNETHKLTAQNWFHKLRDDICASFELLEEEGMDCPYKTHDKPAKFTFTDWQRGGDEAVNGKNDEGGGRMAVMRGNVFEKVGVNCSTVYGRFPDEFISEIKGAKESDGWFWASGISLVAHPKSPHVPIAHMNTRLIMTSQYWFGGGGDLTPIFPIEQDTKDFHASFQSACDAHDEGYYPRFKTWCDEYFYLPHRKEARGVGGIFYDYLDEKGFEKDLAFTKDVGLAFKHIYPDIIRRHYKKPYDENDLAKQYKKRGRYVEFNLLYDRGTRFGLKTDGNIEAILMSLPPHASWL